MTPPIGRRRREATGEAGDVESPELEGRRGARGLGL